MDCRLLVPGAQLAVSLSGAAGHAARCDASVAKGTKRSKHGGKEGACRCKFWLELADTGDAESAEGGPRGPYALSDLYMVEGAAGEHPTVAGWWRDIARLQEARQPQQSPQPHGAAGGIAAGTRRRRQVGRSILRLSSVYALLHVLPPAAAWFVPRQLRSCHRWAA